MKATYLLLLLIFNLTAGAQTILFKLKFYTDCDSLPKPDPELFYTLTSVEYDQIFLSEKEGVKLPGLGRYELSIAGDKDLERVFVTVDSFKSFTYDYKLPKIYRRSIAGTYMYTTCQKAVDGYSEDHYPNGKVRLKGNFIKGLIKDSIVAFYGTGLMKNRVRYFPKEVIVENYDSAGKLVRIAHDKRGPILTDFVAKEYFSTGALKKYELKNEYEHVVKEYYSNGKLKTNEAGMFRYEYYENGKISCEWKWSRKLKSEGLYDFRIERTVFDDDGNFEEFAAYNIWNFRRQWPNLTEELSKCNWIEKWVVVENGKEIIKAVNQAANTVFFD